MRSQLFIFRYTIRIITSVTKENCAALLNCRARPQVFCMISNLTSFVYNLNLQNFKALNALISWNFRSLRHVISMGGGKRDRMRMHMRFDYNKSSPFCHVRMDKFL